MRNLFLVAVIVMISLSGYAGNDYECYNIKRASELIDEQQYKDAGGGLTWEIDVFHGRLDGLVIAEIELPDANTEITLPDFIAAEVTGNPAYYNSNIATNPPPFS